MSLGPPHLGHPAIAPYAYKALGQSQIRVLTLAPGEFSDEIHIRLDHVDLKKDSDVDYEALSYVWGTSEPTQHVIVDADDGSLQFIPVRDNLADALRHVRDTTTAKTLWVDALCIHQEDNGEKSHQVPFMTQIYRDATRVIVWLGTEGEGSSSAMEMLRNLGANMEIDWMTWSYTCSDSFSALSETLDGSESLRHSITALLEREWFERIWVHQEVYLSRQATVLCGFSQVEWTEFTKAAFFFAVPYETLFVLRIYRFARPDPIPWRHLRSVLHGKKCSDPRDRIYGMLSILGGNDIYPLSVDYSLSISEVYTAATKHYVQSYRDLSLFESCGLSLNRLERLPTWVPDWSESSTTGEIWDNGDYAMGNTSLATEFPEPDIMRLAGVMSSKVRSQEPLGQTLSEAKGAMLLILRMVRIGEQYIPGDQGDALICAIISGNYRHTTIPPLDTRPTKETCSITGRYLVSLAAGKASESEAEPTSFLEVTDYMDRSGKGRALFLTEDGHIGLGHQDVAQGDRLFFPLGSESPLLIRPNREPQRNEWCVVSTCYVSGLMAGEILYGPLPSNFCLVETDNYDLPDSKAFHRIDGNSNVSSEPDLEFEKERTRKAFGVEDEKLLTPELLRSKGVPVEWINLV